MEQALVIPKLEQFVPTTSFTLICGGRVETILFNEIIRIEKCGSDSCIYTIDNSFKTHRSIAQLLRDLPVNEFFRINVSQVVALKRVKAFRGNRVYLEEKSYLIMTKHYKQQLLQTLSWLLEQQYQTILHEAGIRIAV